MDPNFHSRSFGQRSALEDHNAPACDGLGHPAGMVGGGGFSVELDGRGKKKRIPRPSLTNRRRDSRTIAEYVAGLLLGLAPGEEGVWAEWAGVGEASGFAGAEIDGDEGRIAATVVGVEDGVAVGGPVGLHTEAAGRGDGS